MIAASPEARGRWTRRAAAASMAVALTLLLLKAWAAWRTGSSAMLGSFADTALDLVASGITLFGVYIAAQPADDDHRFGHGKAEALVALVQMMIVTASALWIAMRAIARWQTGAGTADAPYGIGVSVIAMALTLCLITYQNHVVRRTGSLAISADRLHYTSDLLLNAAVILALIAEQYLGWHGADAAFGLLIALWLLFGAARGAISVIDHLMDKEWPDAKREALVDVVMRDADALGVHDVRTRSSGGQDFVQFHLWVRADMTIREVHDVMDRIEAELARHFPGLEIFIHPDPEGHRAEGAV